MRDPDPRDDRDTYYLCPDCGFYCCECEDFLRAVYDECGPILDGTQGGSAMSGRE